MKKLLYLLIFIVHTSYSQYYYNPKQSIDINITIKEPFKPIDYNKFAEDLNSNLQAEVERRKSIKKYYEDITYETKNSVNLNLILTNNYLIDQIVFNLQASTNNWIDTINSLLNSGMTKPENYENSLKKIYYKFAQANREVAYLSRLKMYKLSSLKTLEEQNNFNQLFDELLNSFGKIRTNENGVFFELISISEYKNQPIGNLTNFISQIIEGKIDYIALKKSSYEKKIEEKLKIEKIQRNNIKVMKSWDNLINAREEHLLSLNKKERKKYLRNEWKAIVKNIDNKYAVKKNITVQYNYINDHKVVISRLRTKYYHYDLSGLGSPVSGTYSGKAFEAIYKVCECYKDDFLEKEYNPITVGEKETTSLAIAISTAKGLAYDLERGEEMLSGIKVYFNKKGSGKKPPQGSKIKINYAAYLVSGTLFDTNIEEIAKQYNIWDSERADAGGYSPTITDYSKNAQLIPGFREGLLLMDVGDRITLFVPANLAYGDRGIPNLIPPGSDLIFNIEIVEIVK
jgi:hypothetical protein